MGEPRSLLAPKIRWVTVFSVLMMLWMLTEMGIFATLTNNSRCGARTSIHTQSPNCWSFGCAVTSLGRSCRSS